MKLSAVPKKSIAAALCAALLFLWNAWNAALWFSTVEFSFEFSAPWYSSVPSLLSPLLGIAVLVWFVLPNNRRYKTGLKVILGIIVTLTWISELISIAGMSSAGSAFGQMAFSLLNLLLNANVILLFGALIKRSTEKLAALAALVWPLASLVIMAMDGAWRTVFDAAALLPLLLWATLLYFHPVLKRPMLQPNEKETEPNHE